MTTSAWERAEQMAERHANQGGLFAKLANDGDSVIGAFCGEPLAREVVWNGQRYEQYDPDNDAHAGVKPASRFSFNFYVPAENAMKVIEGSQRWFGDVLRVRKKYTLEKRLFEIERHGAAGDPGTTYTILPDAEIDKALAAKIAEMELHDLDAIANGRSEGGSKPAGKPAPAKAGPIDPRVGGELVAKLKALPRSDVDAFLAKFGVQRVRDLKASDEDSARAWLDKTPGAEPEGEIDPFA
jgi:hypothetical protein